jgi:hypothetical protein
MNAAEPIASDHSGPRPAASTAAADTIPARAAPLTISEEMRRCA